MQNIFINKLRVSLRDTVREIPRSQHYAGRPELEEIFTEGRPKERSERDRAIAGAVGYGYTLKEIADYLNIHYATVSRALKRG